MRHGGKPLAAGGNKDWEAGRFGLVTVVRWDHSPWGPTRMCLSPSHWVLNLQMRSAGFSGSSIRKGLEDVEWLHVLVNNNEFLGGWLQVGRSGLDSGIGNLRRARAVQWSWGAYFWFWMGTVELGAWRPGVLLFLVKSWLLPWPNCSTEPQGGLEMWSASMWPWIKWSGVMWPSGLGVYSWTQQGESPSEEAFSVMVTLFSPESEITAPSGVLARDRGTPGGQGGEIWWQL